VPTSSEILFAALCAGHGLIAESVPTASNLGEQRPDYRVTDREGRVFFAEVKEVQPNPEETHQLTEALAGRVGAFGTTPGARLREYIGVANRQLRAVTAGQVPALLVVYNTEFFLRHHSEPYAVLTAMRGLDVIPVEVPQDARIAPRFGDVRPGPGRAMRPDANRNISAIAVVTPGPTTGWAVAVYHNRFAACPFPVSSFTGTSITHYDIGPDEHHWVVRGAV
jgi:hypothetical protein